MNTAVAAGLRRALCSSGGVRALYSRIGGATSGGGREGLRRFGSSASSGGRSNGSGFSGGSAASGGKGRGFGWWKVGAGGGLVLFSSVALSVANQKEEDVVAAKPQEIEEEKKVTPGEVIEGLPEYTLADVAAHNTIKNESDRIWVIYRNGVYDITEFLDAHPGTREKILLAAGGRIDPFWAFYRQHATEQVFEMLEALRIGNLAPEDRLTEDQINALDPYLNEANIPGLTRDPRLVVRSKAPFNAETPNEHLVESPIVPNELFYVRNHLPVPYVDPSKFVLEVTIDNEDKKRTFYLTLDEIKSKFPKYEETVTIQCAGNRRFEMNASREVKGLGWDVGGIGTAKWAGARLIDVLEYVGLTREEIKNAKLAHIQFEGLDKDFEKSYGASITIDKAMSVQGETLLAYEMNGVPIPPDHGFPLRAVVPGVVGARSVKWLHKIKASPYESDSQWQQYDYKGFNPAVDWDTISKEKWHQAPSIQGLPVQSAIVQPKNGDSIKASDGKLTLPIKGYAWSGDGRGIARVDISVDGGKTWQEAELHIVDKNQKLHSRWAWTLWSANVQVDESLLKEGNISIVCKAVDSSYNSQPDTVAPIWNLRGLLNNSWHRVGIKVE